MAYVNAELLVKTYLDHFATASADWTALRLLLAPDLKYSSPLGEFTTADEFISDAKANRLAIKNLRVKQILGDAHKVSALYEIESQDPQIARIQCTEWYEVAQNRITSIVACFDASQVRESQMRI